MNTFGALKPSTLPEKSFWPYIVVLATILILGAAGYFFFYKGVGISLTAPDLTPAPPLTVLESRIIMLPAFSFEFFDGDFYKSLKVYGTLPIVVDSLGRSNPFVPY